MRFSVMVAATGVFLASPVAGLAQEEQQQSDQYSPEVAALIAELDAISMGDQSADPEGDLAKIADLRARIAMAEGFPAYEMGNLESAEGAAHFYLRNFDQAAELYGRAAEYFTEADAPPEDMAGLYNNRASILASVGRYEEAEADHRRALAIRQGIEGERGLMVSSSMFGLGFVYYRQGRIEESLEYLRASAEQQLEFAGADDPLTIIRLTSLASVLGRSGRAQEALDVARQAEAHGREHLGFEHPTYAIALNNLGNALVENRLFNEAVPVLRRSLELRLATVGENASGTAITLRNLGTALKGAGAREEAEVLTRRALAIYEATGEVENPFALAYMYSDLAEYAARREDWASYTELSDNALALADAALDNDSSEQAQIHLYRAEWLLRQDDFAGAREEAERWVPVMQSDLIASHPDRLWAEMLLARLRQLQGEDAGSVLQSADDALARLEARLADLTVADAALVREAQTHRETALLYLAIAADLVDPERAFRAMQLVNISELSRGQQFAQPTGDGDEGAFALRDALLDTARRANELRLRLADLQGEDDAEASAALVSSLADAEAEELALREELLATFPDFVARYRPQPLELSAFSQRLSPGDLLVAPVEGDTNSWIIAVGRDSFSSTIVPSRALAAQVAILRDAVDRPDPSLADFPLETAHSLHDAIFPDGLGNTSRLLVHGGQLLASLPLAILLTQDHSGRLEDAPWLVRQASVQTVGNLALFGLTPAVEESAGRRFVGVGGVELPGRGAGQDYGALPQLAQLFRSGRPDIETIADLPALPAASDELTAIATTFPADARTIYLAADAAEENFKSADLRNLSVLAFATHGLVAGEMTGLWEPALLLGTQVPEEEDGLLGASEIARLSMDAEWVILSACSTAAGSSADGPAYSGLATAFAQAGARSLLLSHWRVRDDAAAYLSVRTVSAARDGMNRAEALRQSQLSLMGDSRIDGGAHPAIWAPFVLIEN